MTESIEKRGWNWAAVPIEVIHSKSLSSNAKVVYSSILYRAGKKEMSWPSEETMAEDIGVSVSTIQRALRELVGEDWIRRVRRIGNSAITYIFESQEDCRLFDKESENEASSRHPRSDVHVTGEVSNTSPMKSLNESKLTREKEQRRFELTPEQHEEAMAYLNNLEQEELELLAEKYPVVNGQELVEWPYWIYEIIPRNVAAAEKSRITPVEDLTYVAHFSAETQYIINAFRRAFGFCPGARNSKWEKDAKEFIKQCGDANPIEVLVSIHKEWRESSDRLGRDAYTVNGIGSLVGSVPRVVSRSKPVESTAVIEFDDYGVPILR